MLESLQSSPRDPLWSLTERFHADARRKKLDLVIGVYRDETGATPVLDAVQLAEARLAAEARPKTYRPLAGNEAFNSGMIRLLVGNSQNRIGRTISVQTVGGSGALRMLGELIANASPVSTVWISDPGYINHWPLMRAAGLRASSYRHREREGAADAQQIIADLKSAKSGDVILVQGCCHNPSGFDLSLEGWNALADLCEAKGLTPLIDMAYQGLGDGLEADAAGLRLMIDRLDTVMIASSCSKNMGLYSERVGAALLVTSDSKLRDTAKGVMEQIGRCTYSMPPEHGAAIAAILMAEPAAWEAELGKMRVRIQSTRIALAAALRRFNAPDSMQSLVRHKGMFSVLPLNAAAMEALRVDHGVYGTTSGRINVAGLAPDSIDYLAQALSTVAHANSATAFHYAFEQIT